MVKSETTKSETTDSETILTVVPNLEKMNIFQRVSAISAEVGAVKKHERNIQQKFNFRGVDAVVNAVAPKLQKYGVVVIPTVVEKKYEQITYGSNKTFAQLVQLMVVYKFIAGDQTFIEATVVSEAMDSGDKATAKAMSVAFRTVLLQVFSLPTDEADPDESSFVTTANPLVERNGDKPNISADEFTRILKEMGSAQKIEVLSKVANQLEAHALTARQHQEAIDLFLSQKTTIEQSALEGEVKDIKSDISTADDGGSGVGGWSELPLLDDINFVRLSELFEYAPTFEVLNNGIEQAKLFKINETDRIRLLAIHSTRKKALNKEMGQ